ncbi:membrane-associated oxidoreductase [Streptomyces sp. SAS_270]|uniref:membrane-associated oxidoreductase n=1 Tax=Streptomyces sp. SAS_270 TaxID=3412748 RepID=UPI00403CC7C8
MEINDLTPAERRVWEAFPRSESVDFRASDDEDAAQAGDWGPERTLRATALRAILLNAPHEDGEIPGLKVAGARISGDLNLMYAVIDSPIRLSHCFFHEAPNFYGSRLRQLNLSKSVLPGLHFGSARIDGVLRMTDCRMRGPVRLGGTQIAGALFMDRAAFASPSGPDEEPALQLNQAAIGDDLWAPGMRSQGQVRLDGATVAGSMNLEGTEFRNPAGDAFSAETLSVGADVRARELRAHGRVDLRGARIPGRLDLMRAHLSNPGGTALRASSCTIGELWLPQADPIVGSVNLRRAHMERVHVAPETLPDRLRIDGFTYTVLAPHEPAERRLPMLERDGNTYAPYAYEQLTAAYRRIGDDDAARKVQLAKQRRHRATLTWYARAWGHLQDATVGYGFRPLRAAVWLLSLLAVGSIAYGLHHPPPVKADEAPDFSPVFYTLDLLLPIIDFGQEHAFSPEGWYQGLSYVLIITGWVLASTIVAGVTRAVSRQ